ncbi:unnamed protein product [Protopolystoma xenopodis]|uniref:Fibronectin type-III domain-containing protein n=1 Tax=Protopolystoma xenopodis TaxID=117903 RepID=A0A448WEX2_9PLAT|nr:unnamed protein product [Protopolystoma xenopodis]
MIFPGPPENVNLDANFDPPLLNWASPLVQGSGPITFYQANASSRNHTIFYNSIAPPLSMVGLRPCNSYEISLQAINNEGGGLPFTMQLNTSVKAASQPRYFLISNVAGTSSQEIRWRYPNFTAIPCSSEYEVQYREVSASVATTVVYNASMIAYKIENLRPQTVYVYRIRSVTNPGGLSSGFTPWRKRRTGPGGETNIVFTKP